MKNFNKNFEIELKKFAKAKGVDVSAFDIFMAANKMKSFTSNPEAAADLLVVRKVFPRLALNDQKTIVYAIRTSDYKIKSEVIHRFTQENNLVVEFIIK